MPRARPDAPRAEARREFVYRTLRDRILEGSYGPLEPLSEEELARTLGVSRTPVREALVALEQRGLVRRIPGKGCVVSEAVAHRVRWLYEIREVLEGLSARLATGRLPPERLEAYRKRFREALTQGTAGTALWETAEAFHRELAEASGNRILVQLLDEARGEVGSLRALSLLSGRSTASAAEHLAVVEALLAGDAEAAEQAMRRHLAGVREAIARLGVR